MAILFYEENKLMIVNEKNFELRIMYICTDNSIFSTT